MSDPDVGLGREGLPDAASPGPPHERGPGERRPGQGRPGRRGAAQERLRTRASWTLADQALSSLTNFALSLVVARAVDASSFGAFSVAFAVFSFVLGMNRAMASEPLVVRFSTASTRDLQEAARAATGLSLVFGAIAGLACLIAAPILGGGLRELLPALAVVLPGLMLQDTWRYVFFAGKRPASATANDLAWALLQVVGIGGILLLGAGAAPAFIVAWGAAAVGAAGYGYVQLGVVPAPARSLRWLRDHRDLAPMLLLEYVLTMGSFNLALVVIGVVGTLADVGSLRAAHVLLGPLQLLFFGAATIALPELARRLDRPKRTLLGYAALTSGGLAAVAVAWTVVVLALPEAWGVRLLGESWAGAREVLPPYGVHMTAIAVGSGAAYLLRALADGRRVLLASAVQSPFVFLLGIGGVLAGGAFGASAGFAAAHWIGAVVWWVLLLRSMRRWVPAEPGAGTDAPER